MSIPKLFHGPSKLGQIDFIDLAARFRGIQ